MIKFLNKFHMMMKNTHIRLGRASEKDFLQTLFIQVCRVERRVTPEVNALKMFEESEMAVLWDNAGDRGSPLQWH